MFLVSLSFVSANIKILNSLQDTYNLNEKISLQTSISYKEEISGYVKVNIDCDNYDLDYFVTPFNFKTTDQNLNIPELILTSNMLGKCSINIILTDLDNNLLDQALVKLIDVTDKLNLNILLEKKELDPGKNLIVKGTVKNIRNLDIINPVLTISFDENTYEYVLDKSDFRKEIPLDAKIKSGKHIINILVKDSYNNKAETALEFNIIPKPSYLKNLINKLEFLPGETVEISSLLYDQANEKIENDATIKLYNPKNRYITQGYGKVIYVLPKDALPGTWIIKTSESGFDIEARFLVKEVKQAAINLYDGILEITNTGNVNYIDEIKVSLNGYEFTRRIDLSPGESEKIDLSKKVPSGNYDIVIRNSLEEKTFPNAFIPKSEDPLYLTGVAVKNFGNNFIEKPYLLVALLAAILLILYLINRNKKITQRKREYEAQIASIEATKIRKERERERFKPKKFSEMSNEELKDYRKQILKNMKEEKKEEENPGYRYKPPKEGKGLFNMFE